jgi:hypothetical protein
MVEFLCCIYDEAFMASFDVTPYSAGSIEPPKESLPGSEIIELLRQILDAQREHLALARAAATAHDVGSRWRAFLARWREDFPDLSDSSRDALAVLEKSYGALLAELVDHLRQNGSGALDTDFALQEFLDRYGMRLTQLGTILNLVAPLAEANSQGESS